MILAYIFILMFFCWFLSLIDDYIPQQYYKYFVWGIIFLMVIISATRPGTNASDYNSYVHMFNNYDSPKYQLTTEPTFLWISKIINNIGGDIRWLIWCYAFISIPLKIFSFSRMIPFRVFLLAIPIYLANFFQLHDCEQMRVAAALSFGVFCYFLRINGKKWEWIPFWLISISFHYTALALIIPILLVRNNYMNIKWRIGLMVFGLSGIFFWATKINPITIIPIPLIEAKMALYEIAIAKGEHPDILVIHPITLLRIITFIFVLYYYDLIYEQIKCINFILICEALALFCWFGLSSISVFAVRMSELFEIPEIIMFAAVIYTVKPVWLGKIYPLAFALYLFLYGCKVNQFGFL